MKDVEIKENKKYWWLKLREDFFKQKEMKKLRRIAGGDTYTIIYLKIQLLSLNNKGIIIFESIGDDIADELALELDESVENVQMTLAFLQQHKLMEQISADEYVVHDAVKSMGSESVSAERTRQYRQRLQANKDGNKMLASHCDTDVTACDNKVTLDIDQELELDLPPLYPPHGGGEGVTSSESLAIETVAGTAQAVGRSTTVTESFALFWQTYPNQKARTAAEKEWRKLDPAPQLVTQILAAVEKQKLSRQWLKEDGQYIPEPANWLTKKRWLDETSGSCRLPAASYSLGEIEALLK